MLYLIGIGLGNEKDITIKGLEAVKSCEKVFLETYTSRLADFDLEKLSEFYGKEIILADRDFIENKCEDEILKPAKDSDVALLIVGSPLSATTHIDLLLRTKKMNIDVEIIDNAGVFGAIGITGLSLYKFGRVVTIPQENENVSSPYKMMIKNKNIGLHTLVLLDVKNMNNEIELMTAKEGLDYLIKQGLNKEEKVVVCGGLGGEDAEIRYGKACEVKISKFPQCIILLGELHFIEEESLERFK